MNDYASRQRTPRKHVVGFLLVVVLHGLIFWAIHSGLARNFVKVVKGPVEALLLEENKPDIPPPPPPPPPKNAPPPPPPAYVPPPDVVVNNAPVPTSAIAAVSSVPEPTPAPPPPPQVVAPPAPAVRVAAVINAAQNCEKPAYPAASRRAEEEGTVHLKFLVGVDGRVVDSQVETSSGYKRLDDAARAAMSRCLFKPATVDGRPEQSWASMKYNWRLE